jgi:hypothetical protein
MNNASVADIPPVTSCPLFMHQLRPQFFFHEVELLSPPADEELFCRQADPWYTDPKYWADTYPKLQQYTKSIVEACAGLPLALEIMGAALKDKRAPKEWQVRGCGLQTPGMLCRDQRVTRAGDVIQLAAVFIDGLGHNCDLQL